MLTVNRRHSIHKQFQATRDRQICRAWRVERHDKTGRQHRSARWVLAITGLRKPTCTGRMIKKCSLAVIGKVSAPASRIQVYGITTLDDPTAVNAMYPFSLTQAAKVLGYKSWHHANQLIMIIEQDKGVNIKRSDNKYHVAIMAGQVMQTHKYSQAAIDLLELVKSGEDYEVQV